jgi:hypothetical protein
MRKTTKGFALLWVIVIVAILAAIAGTAAPYLQEINDMERAATTMVTLRQVGTGIVAFGGVIRRVSTGGGPLTFPGKISYLTAAPTPAVTADHNTCGSAGTGNQYSTTSVSDWGLNGPFVTFQIPPGGRWTPIGRIRDSINVRTATGAMFMEIPGVEMLDATNFDSFVDNGTGDTVSILHGAAVGVADTTTVRIRVLTTAQGTALNRC